MTSLKPLIAVCGTTGVGKSKLGVELALKLSQEIYQDCSSEHRWRGARIINSDSMQVYTGMDVITNKIPQAERMGVEHLLMDFKQPGEQYVVGQWVHDAIQVIEETHKMNQIPVVVGGTSYWIQHLLFPNRLANKDLNSTPIEATTSGHPMSALQNYISQLTLNLLNLWTALPESPPNAVTHPEDALSLHELLQALDPPVASRWHWRDTRKVLRSLRIMKETSRTPSEIISEQSESPLIPRYRTLCFWVYAEPSALNPRLDERVDDMIKQDLLDEIRSLRKIASLPQAAINCSSVDVKDEPDSPASDPDYTVGIYQCIGFKEFHEFLSLSNGPGSQEAFKKAVENMKQSTRKYAKRQITWLRNKLLPAIHSANIHYGNEIPMASMYILDATVLGNQWTSNVLSPAESITKSFLREEELPPPASLSSVASAMFANKNKSVHPSDVLKARKKIVCQVCTTDPRRPVMIDEQHWDAHRGNRLHRRLIAKSKKGSEGLPPRHRDSVAPKRSSADESLDPDESLHTPC
ncbi:tRNA isopentenyltransferase [Boletus edulis BED1]|uniref:tRNA isopentenyltransferase n=1 Tax=Boletus edulis BED1 TaxID=1328754 RepID=A0AAD4BQU3_BOLED|nr:tRNA isopentenyltransferase [Boletus edulis BED1]